VPDGHDDIGSDSHLPWAFKANPCGHVCVDGPSHFAVEGLYVVPDGHVGSDFVISLFLSKELCANT
jgi:hypothetical protein